MNLFRGMLVAVCAFGFAGSAQAQYVYYCPNGQCQAPSQYYYTQPAYTYAPAASQPQVGAPTTTAADPYGFVNWLNTTRASYGLPPVGYDPNLTAWAHVNNTHQNARGMGHHVMGTARRQNSGMGNYSTVCSMWMQSGPHRAALLDPSIRWVGIAGLGAYWTFSAN